VTEFAASVLLSFAEGRVWSADFVTGGEWRADQYSTMRSSPSTNTLRRQGSGYLDASLTDAAGQPGDQAGARAERESQVSGANARRLRGKKDSGHREFTIQDLTPVCF